MDMFALSNTLAVHRGKSTPKKSDMRLARNLRHNWHYVKESDGTKKLLQGISSTDASSANEDTRNAQYKKRPERSSDATDDENVKSRKTDGAAKNAAGKTQDGPGDETDDGTDDGTDDDPQAKVEKVGPRSHVDSLD